METKRQLAPSEIAEAARQSYRSAQWSLKDQIRYNLPNNISLIASSVTILLLFVAAAGFFKANYGALISVILFLVYPLIFVLILGWQIHTFARKSRYAETTGHIHAIAHILRDTAYMLNKEKCDLPVMREKLSDILTFLAAAFGLITGTRCRVCIKIIHRATPEQVNLVIHKYKRLNLKEFPYYATTLARDRASRISCVEIDQQESVLHWLLGNTDFEILMIARQPHRGNHFISNDLTKDSHYESTSFDLYGNPSRGKWTLPYKSTIVWPIRKYLHDEEGGDFGKQELLGFLCVDSYARGVFEERYDFDFGANVADQLYSVMEGSARVNKEEHPRGNGERREANEAV